MLAHRVVGEATMLIRGSAAEDEAIVVDMDEDAEAKEPIIKR